MTTAESTLHQDHRVVCRNCRDSIPDGVFRQRHSAGQSFAEQSGPLCLKCAEEKGSTPVRQGLCPYCARNVYSTPKPSRTSKPDEMDIFYCSDAHEQAHRRFLVETVSWLPNCAQCGVRFQPGKKSEKYCSTSCRHKALQPSPSRMQKFSGNGKTRSGLHPIPSPQGTEPRDFQRKKFYMWESRLHGTRDFDEELSHDEWLTWMLDRSDAIDIESAVDLVNRVFSEYGVEAPLVGSGQGRRSACFEAPSDYLVTTWDRRKVRNTRGIIKLPRWSRIVPVVLHECAHGLVMAHYNVSVAGHGPEFINQYLDLLVSYAGFDERIIRQSARSAKLRF